MISYDGCHQDREAVVPCGQHLIKAGNEKPMFVQDSLANRYNTVKETVDDIHCQVRTLVFNVVKFTLFKSSLIINGVLL